MDSSTHHSFGFVFEQYFENASFLWVLYNIALDQPHYSVGDIQDLKSRIDKNLRGLLRAPQKAWSLCEPALDIEAPGELFTSAMIAFYSGDPAHIESVVDNGMNQAQCTKALVSALCWLPPSICQPWIKQLLLSKNLDHKHLAIETLSALRQDPGDYLSKLLERDDCTQHQNLLCSCLRLIGELKRQDLNPTLNVWLSSDHPAPSFWAAWSLTLLGHKQGLALLEKQAFEPSPHQCVALELVFRSLPIEQAREHISNLAQSDQQRLIIRAAAILGDPKVIPWLIDTMQQTPLARAAAEAYTIITGTNIEELQLDFEAPENFSAGPSDSEEDDDIDMDPDENLPWPNVALIKQHWQTIKDQFEDGRRFFRGERLSAQALEAHIPTAPQRQRYMAALHLAMLEPNQAFINTKI